MNLLKQTFLTFLTAIITIAAVYGGYTIYAADEEELDFRQPDKGIIFVEATYHKAMNKYFNDKMAHLVKVLEDKNFTEHEDFKAPEEGQECSETNVSTYCVAMGATDMYVDLLETLDKMEGTLVIEDGTISPDEVLIDTGKRDNDIARIIEESQLVLDATLATYNEFRLAYPMHKQYEEVMTNLINYRKSLEDIRNEVVKFPSKFIDSSSSYCK